MNSLHLKAHEVLKLMDEKKITSEKYIKELLKHINVREKDVGAFHYLNQEYVIKQAIKSDINRRKGKNKKLSGLPIGIKDIIDTYDMPTENGSKIDVYRQPKKDAHLVKLLREAGAIIFGKCVTTEYALSAPGKTKNPRDLQCTPGGSSSGSAAAVADNMIPVAIGTQTGGSVLRPASFNGIYGFKPTFGTVSRSGISPISYRLDHPGIYGNCIEDIELISSVILSYDENDTDMIKNYKFYDKNDMSKNVNKFAFIKGPAWEFGDLDMKLEIDNYLKNSDLDYEIIDLPKIFDKAIECHELIMNASIYNSLKYYYKNAKKDLHEYTVKRIENGKNISASDYIQALQDAKKMNRSLEKIFYEYDLIITPSSPGQAPRDLSTTGNAVFNGYWTMLGLPCISVPMLKGKDDLPIGIQVVAPTKKDYFLLKAVKENLPI